MARNPKQDANLKPIKKGQLSSEEAKKRGAAGAKKSAETRRAKRDQRQAANYILNLVAKGVPLEQVLSLGGEEKDGITNQEVLYARLYTMAYAGNMDAFDRLMKAAGKDVVENRLERESINADRRRDIDTKFKMDTMAARAIDSANVAVNFGDEDGHTDVVIYLPQVEKEEDLEVPEEDPEDTKGQESGGDKE